MKNKILLISIFSSAIILALGLFLFNKNKDNTQSVTSSQNLKSTTVSSQQNSKDSHESHSNNSGEFIADDGFYLRSDEIFQNMINGDKPTLIMFGKKSCHYCNIMRPYYKELAESNDKINIRYVDININPEISKQYPVHATPAMLYFLPNKKPYIPSDNYKKYNFYSYNEKGKNDIGIVMSYGLLEKNILEGIVKEMIDAK